MKNPPAGSSGGGLRFARGYFLEVQPPHTRRHECAADRTTIRRGPLWIGEHGSKLSRGVLPWPTQISNREHRTHETARGWRPRDRQGVTDTGDGALRRLEVRRLGRHLPSSRGQSKANRRLLRSGNSRRIYSL